jgi:hypothetical protein
MIRGIFSMTVMNMSTAATFVQSQIINPCQDHVYQQVKSMSYTIFLLEITVYFCLNFKILFDLIYNCFHQSYDLLVASSKPARTHESRDRLSVFSERHSGIRDIH